MINRRNAQPKDVTEEDMSTATAGHIEGKLIIKSHNSDSCFDNYKHF